MNASAVVTITDQHGSSRSFRGDWAHPAHVIANLADFLLWADQAQHRLTAETWLAYADTYPGLLPRDEVTGTRAADPQFVGDLDYRYHLDLHEHSGALRLVALSLRGPDEPRKVTELTRASLFAEAARLYDLLATHALEHAGRHDGVLPPGADPDRWRAQARRMRRVHGSATVTALAANLGTQLKPGTFDQPFPSLSIAGIRVIAGVATDGTLHLAVHARNAADWLRRPDGTTVVHLTLHGDAVTDPP